MRNHDEKIKDMQRSVLPSTSRKAARAERRRIHQRQRARERDVLAEYRLTRPTASDEFDPDFREGRRRSDTENLVCDRRTADKIGPLTRWAVRTVQADPDLRDAGLPAQVAYFEAVLPGDLIGQHAAFHISWALEWEFHRGARRRYWESSRGPSREERRRQVAADARRILEDGRHKELNVQLRRAYDAWPLDARPWSQPRPPVVRLLRGLHDVDGFAAEVAAHAWLCNAVADVRFGRGVGNRS